MIGRRVWAIRHAPTSAHGLCVGQSNVSTSLAPDDAAACMAGRLPAAAFSMVWSSPRDRCADPARRLADALTLPLHLDVRLDEISFGAWEGRTWRDIEIEDGAMYAEWMDNWARVAPAGGEAVHGFSSRVQGWWDSLDSGDHLLIAHAGVVRALRVIVNGVGWADAMSAPVEHLRGEWFPGERAETA